jgi:hypothetical protein
MNPLMAKRKKSKPRQQREPVEIKSAEEQIREARDCAKRAACDDQRRSDIKRQRQKQQSEERDRKARDQAARNKEIVMDLMCHEVPDALTVLDPSKRAKPGVRSKPSGPAPPPRGEFFAKPTIESLQLGAAQLSSGPRRESTHTREHLRRRVEDALENGVFCALPGSSSLLTWEQAGWETSKRPGGKEWTRPDKWMSLVCSWRSNNLNNLVPVSNTGTFNNVLAPSERTEVDDAAMWPPQLSEIVGTNGEYVIRMTRLDPFPCSKEDLEADNQVYRYMRRDEAVTEITTTMHAALTGVGPPIYAALAWPWNLPPHSTKQRYGLIIVTERCSGDMSAYVDTLRGMYPPENVLQSSNPRLRSAAEKLAIKVAEACARVSAQLGINFDIKCANMLLKQHGDDVYLCDFDPIHFVYPPPEVVGAKACMLTNLLLVCMHVRAYSLRTVAVPFLAMLAPLVMKLLEEAVSDRESFGRGFAWLLSARIAPTLDTGSFDETLLKRTQEAGLRLSRHLTMMVFEYMFNQADGKRPSATALRWKGWDFSTGFVSGYARLLPQLVRFSFFYDTPPGPADERVLELAKEFSS